VGEKKLVGGRLLCVGRPICSTFVRLDVKCEATLRVGDVFFFLLLSSHISQSLTLPLDLASCLKSIVSRYWYIARSGWEMSHVLLMSCPLPCRLLAVSLYSVSVSIVSFTSFRLLFTSRVVNESHLLGSQ
jgi:hypothetical protein